MKKYDHSKLEPKWQKAWDKAGIYKAKDFSKKKKWYSLIEFPYPSGQGLHVGHVKSNTAMDIVSRKRRMQGYNVLYPIGWDAFGLPTENYAVKTGIHPAKVTKQNTKIFEKQLRRIGFSFDWDRLVDTTDPEYYKWTQWIFLQLFKKGLAYKGKTTINWCPNDKIGLANEEVVGGKCERCGHTVEQRVKEQWMLKITAYADKLLKGLDGVDFLPEIKRQQANWIGRSEGAEIDFPISTGAEKITVFTTRPDTLFGATYMVLAPEHELIQKIMPQLSNREAVEEYVKLASGKSDEERIADARSKTGVPLRGILAINPATKKEIPIFVADYVLSNYGTGAIMAVPAHDERDLEFAIQFGLPVVTVVSDTGELVDSGPFSGMRFEEAKRAIVSYVNGRPRVNYHLRDWVFSRQRYWGEPIPLVHCADCGWVPVPDKDLPVKLPQVKDFRPRSDGESPLASATAWLKTKCPVCKKPARRETDVMPNWAGSSWYFLRYVDPKNKKTFADIKKLKYWMNVDWYNGGMEHVTLHLLYSRFWNQFLYDCKLVPKSEPYAKRTAHGMILGEGGVKMSKSRGNVVNPDTVIKAYGADTLRMYEMFMGPFDQAISWDPKSIEGLYRFLNRVWTIGQGTTISARAKNEELVRLTEKTLKKVDEDIEKMAFNTAISAMMVLSNEMSRAESIPEKSWAKFLCMLAPFAPHITEELWQARFGAKKFSSLHVEKWPKWETKLVKEDLATIVVQVNGKTRSILKLPTDSTRQIAEKAAKEDSLIRKYLEGASVKNVIFVPNRLINFVI
jgi:leucyl-tRNA synthetase